MDDRKNLDADTLAKALLKLRKNQGVQQNLEHPAASLLSSSMGVDFQNLPVELATAIKRHVICRERQLCLLVALNVDEPFQEEWLTERRANLAQSIGVATRTIINREQDAALSLAKGILENHEPPLAATIQSDTPTPLRKAIYTSSDDHDISEERVREVTKQIMAKVNKVEQELLDIRLLLAQLP